MNDDIMESWYRFLDKCRSDSGYPHSYQAGLDRQELARRWDTECPGLSEPSVLWSNDEGRYILTLPTTR